MAVRDFENPADNGADNTYDVTITATDNDNNTATQSWSVTVTVNDTNSNIAPDSKFLLKQYGINTGILRTLLASFTYVRNSSNDFGVYKVNIINGIQDKMYGVEDEDGHTNSHNFIYLPIVSPITGKLWLNNNLGADYANVQNPFANFNPGQQSTDNNDSKAYGSLFQWGRAPDGHELINRGVSGSGTARVNTTITNTKADNPNSGVFIIADNWRSNSDAILWASEASANNPCPKNWRVPTKLELKNEVTSITDSTSAQTNFLKLTPAGHLNRNNGVVDVLGSDARYWTSTEKTNDLAWNFRLNNASVNTHINNDKKGYGGSIR
jgi:hypothetical protein